MQLKNIKIKKIFNNNAKINCISKSLTNKTFKENITSYKELSRFEDSNLEYFYFKNKDKIDKSFRFLS